MLQLCNIARNILREVVFCNLSHSGTRKMCQSRIYHSNRFRFPGLFVPVTCFLVFSVWLYTTTSYKSTSDTVPYFGLNGLSMILFLWSLLHPLSKLPAIQDPAQNLEVSIIRYLTDLWIAAIWSKKGRFFLRLSRYFASGWSFLLRKV